VTFETNDNYSIRFEMKKHYSHITTPESGQIRLQSDIKSQTRYTTLQCSTSNTWCLYLLHTDTVHYVHGTIRRVSKRISETQATREIQRVFYRHGVLVQCPSVAVMYMLVVSIRCHFCCLCACFVRDLCVFYAGFMQKYQCITQSISR